MSQNETIRKDLKALRRPFLRELFRENRSNLAMTLVSSVLMAAGQLVVSWLIKEIVDLISGLSGYTFGALLAIAGGGVALMALAAVIDYTFLSRFRAKAMKQYREYVFSRLLDKGIQAFSGENSSLYLSALSNDVTTIERDFLSPLQNMLTTALAFAGALGLMLWYSPLLTLVAIGFSLLPIFVSVVFGSKAEKAEKAVSDRKEHYTGMLKDTLTGFAVIKSSKAERNIARMHDAQNESVAEATKKRTGIGVLIGSTSGIAGGILQFGVFFVAAAMALSGNSSVTGGTAIVFVQLLNYVLGPIQAFPAFFAGANPGSPLCLRRRKNRPGRREYGAARGRLLRARRRVRQRQVHDPEPADGFLPGLPGRNHL